MADNIVRLRVDSQEYDNKLKRAAEGLNRYIEGCRKAGDTLEQVDDGVKEFTQQLGKMETVAGGAKGKLGEMTKAFTDLTMQFNQMSEAEKRGQFGKALSAGLDELKQRIISTKKELADINSSLNGGAISGGGLFGGGKLDGMLQVFGGNLMTKGAGMLAGLATEMGDMVKQGIELAKQGDGIRIAFERLGRGDILQGLREATHGTVTDLELMKAAVKFNDFKLPLDQLGTMLAFAQQKAKDTGQDVNYLVDSIVTGLGRKSLMILDNLGLSATEIRERMKETGDMTKAVGAIIREQMSKAGDYVETAADRATQANVSLQNKMEELGRKFAPLEEASNNFWTSMKIGILDVVGGPLTNLLNKLTEAGRLMNAYGKIGGNTKVGRMTSNLASASEGNRQSVYQQQQAQFWRYINPREQQIKDIRAWQSGERNEALQKRIGAITEKYGSLDATKIQAEVDAAKKMLAEYQQAARSLLTPVKADVDTTDAGNKGLGGSTTTTTTKHQTPQQRAQESFTKAEQNYKQALDQAAMELQAGTITRAQAKQKELQAAEQRWKAIGDARNINDSDRLRKAQDEAAAEYKRLAAEVKTATEHQKALDKVTRDLENANQKLADARSEMAAAERSGDRRAYYAAEKKATTAQQEVTRLEKVKVNVEQGRVDLPDIPKVIEQTVNIEATTSNLDAEIANMKDKMSQLTVGSDAFNMDLAKMVDFTTLRTMINEKVKNGLTIDPEASANLMNQIINGENITDEAWQGIIDKINEKLKELNIEPIKIDFKTGESAKTGKETEKAWKGAASAVQSVGSALQGLEDPGAKIAGIIGQAIANIALGFSQATAADSKLGVFGWIAAITGGLATMVSTISAIHSATGYAQGGIVEGNTYSGDQIPANGGTIGLNAGELILNKAQQGNLASQIQGGGLQGLYLEASVHAEQIRLALNNNGKRTGRGELVTWKRS